MKLLYQNKGLLVLIAVMSVLIFLRYGELLQWSSYKVIEPFGDGIKNYTIIQYHVQHDSTYSFYEGMNYPYGEHAVPASTEPLVSNTLKFLSGIFGDLSGYTIPVVNHFMLLGILLTAVFLFLIFKHQRLPAWFGILAAVGITFLAPQNHRMTSHYGLAHPEVIPALIYFLLRFSEACKIKWSLAIAALVFLYPLVHFYYFPITVFFISLYFLIYFLRDISWAKLKVLAGHYGIQVGLPLLFFIYWLILMDPIDGRNSKPWGFLHYKANIQGIFTSLTQPHFRWVNDRLVTFGNVDFEAQNYFGMIGVFFTIIVLLQWARRWLGKSDLLPTIDNKWVFDRFLVAAFLLLLLAFGLPFVIPGLEFLLDYAGPLEQFRGIGRFAWLLFYLINIVGFVYLYEWSRGGDHWLRKILPFAALFVLFFEAYHFSYARDYSLEEIKELKEGNRYTDSNIDFSKYQAILPIPYYNLGSGNFWWPYNNSFSLQQSQVLSLQTGLPVTAAQLTRSSPYHAIKQLQLVLEPYRSPLVFKDYPNDKPLLLLWDHYQKEREEYRGKYPHFEGAGITLFDEGNIRLAELPLESFEQRIEARKDSIRAEIARRDTLFRFDGFLSTSEAKNFLYRSWDDQNSGKPYWGEGGLMFKMPKQITIFEGQMPAAQAGQNCELLIWMYIKRDLNTRSHMVLEEVDAGGQVVRHYSDMVWRTVKVIDDTGWAMLEIPFVLQNADGKLAFRLENKDLRNKTFYLDELLIKPKEMDLYRKENGVIWKNNRWFTDK